MTDNITEHQRIDALTETLMAMSRDIRENLSDTDAAISLVNGRLHALEQTPAQPDRTELFAAFVKAQANIKNATLNTDNEFTKKKYADLASVMDAVRGPLAEQGLAIMQFTHDPGQGMLGIRTLLVHTSGQCIEDVITMHPPKNDPQGVGSCRTYMRRYAVLALIGIAGAVDDDAENTKKGPEEYDRITVAETESIIYHADELLGDRADEVVARMLKGVFMGASCVGDIAAGQAPAAIQAIDNAHKLIEKKAKAAAKQEDAARKAAKEEK